MTIKYHNYIKINGSMNTLFGKFSKHDMKLERFERRQNRRLKEKMNSFQGWNSERKINRERKRITKLRLWKSKYVNEKNFARLLKNNNKSKFVQRFKKPEQWLTHIHTLNIWSY